MSVPVINFPPFRPYSNITPFTVRDGATYLTVLEELRNWLNTTLVPHVDTEVANLVIAWEDNANTLLANVITALNEQNDIVTAQLNAQNASILSQLNDQNAAITAQLAAQDASVADQINTMTAYVDNAVQSIINSTIEVSDPVILGVLNDPDSDTRAFFFDNFGLKPTNGERSVGKNELVANALDYGAVGDGVTDSTAAIQAAIDNASLNAPEGTNGVVYLPPGTYKVTTLTIKPRVTIRGAGRYKTIISALPSSEVGLIQLAAGPVQAAYIEDVQIAPGASPNVGQHGIYFYGRAQSPGVDGGWWYGGLRHVRVAAFDGINIWLRGGGTDHLKPHQFLTFDHVESFSKNSVTGRSLLLSGQVGQVTFNSCQFDGAVQGSKSAGTCVEIKRETDSTNSNIISDASPYALTFTSCTFQANTAGVRIERASGNTFVTCWFEDLSKALEFTTSAEMNSVIGCTFADAGYNDTATGYCISVGSTSTAHIDGCRFAGAHDRGVTVNGTNGNVTGNIGYSVKSGFFPVTGMTRQPAITGNAIDLIRATTAIIVGGGMINTINGRHATGESVFIRATSTPITLETGGNINLSGKASPVTIPEGSIAHLVKQDHPGVTGAWWLVGIS